MISGMKWIGVVSIFSVALWGCVDDEESDDAGMAGMTGAGGAGGMAAAGGAMAGAGGAGGLVGEGGAGGEGGTVSPDCLPYDDMCPDGQYCQYQDDGLRCIDNSDVVAGATGNWPDCPEGACSRGAICLEASATGVDSGAGDELRCYPACAPQFIGTIGASCGDMPGCCHNGRHTCHQATDENGDALAFGVCRYGG